MSSLLVWWWRRDNKFKRRERELKVGGGVPYERVNFLSRGR